MKIQYNIRIDLELLNEIKKSAKENERSVTGEIIYRLKTRKNGKQIDNSRRGL